MIVLVGPSGGGKSHFANGRFDSLEIVSTDEIRRELCGGDLRRQDKNELVFDEFEHRIMTKLRANQRVVADATHIRNKDRRRTAEIGRMANVPVIYVVINRDGVTKHKHGGWRTDIVVKGKTLIDRHEETFVANETEILRGDGMATLVVDTRVDEFEVVQQLPRAHNASLDALIRRGFRFVRAVGDIHGNMPGMEQAIDMPEDFFLLSLGDVVDYGSDTLNTAMLMNSIVMSGRGIMIRGNHERKISRFVETERAKGWEGIATHGNNVTINQLKAMTAEGRMEWEERFLGLVEMSPDWIQMSNTIFAHGAIHERMWGNSIHRAPRNSALESLALYGETTGEKDPRTGFPIRKYDWVDKLPAGTTAVVGHAVLSIDEPVVKVGALGGKAIFLDTGSSKEIEDQGHGHLSWMDFEIVVSKSMPTRLAYRATGRET